jgi:regulator of sirC expression with transglutaminase-like and TPR domain
VQDVGVDAVQRFVRLVSAPEPPLDEAALLIAAGADPSLDPGRWLHELDRLAAGVDSLPRLLRRLFLEEGFRGNASNYYDPRNSLLPHVLTRRTGIPISLAVVCIEVGRRAGIPLEGVGMPGHFLVRVPGTDQHLDVFDGGRRLDLAGCEARFRTATGAGPRIRFGPHLLARASTREILSRMLENLRGVYRAGGGPARREWVLRMRLALRADEAALVELGEVLGEQGRWGEGSRLIDTWLASRARVDPPTRDRLVLASRTLRAHLN